MRTTINIDDDVLLVVQSRARRERRSAGAVLSELAREALAGPPLALAQGSYPNGFRPFPHRGPPVTNELINELREEEGV